ncbi:MAG: hypothetical protein Q9201_007310, partial [Fulgogasparrea decipioides]
MLEPVSATSVLPGNPSSANRVATATFDPQLPFDAWGARPSRLEQTLQISQYARKDPNDGGDAGKYWISAGVTAPSDQFPGGANEGSTGGPQVASSGHVDFDIKNTLDGQMHKVVIHTPLLNSTGDLDQVPLRINGFPGKGEQFDTSDPG